MQRLDLTKANSSVLTSVCSYLLCSIYKLHNGDKKHYYFMRRNYMIFVVDQRFLLKVYTNAGHFCIFEVIVTSGSFNQQN